MDKRLKVLLSAYACEPNRGSEPGVGWNWVKQIARFHDVWVITRKNNRPAIEAEISSSDNLNIHWIYYDLPRGISFWKKGIRGVHLYYYLWQLMIYQVAKKINREVAFDVVHHVTFANYWMTSFLPFLDAPFIWGPVGGGDGMPPQFFQTLNFRGKIYEHVRNMIIRIAEFDPFLRHSAHRSKIAFATTENTAKRMERIGTRQIRLLSQVGLTKDEINQLGMVNFRDGRCVRFISIGNLIHLKGFHLSLAAFAKIVQQYPDSEYWIVGNGPEEKNLRRDAVKWGLDKNVVFCGSMTREKVWDTLRECDVLIHPSLHDSGGMVCAEAMAAGRPVICLDWGGPGLQVTEDTGFKIPVSKPNVVVEEIEAIMSAILEDSSILVKKGNAARKRVQDFFSWDHKGEQLNQVYQSIICSQYKLNS